MKTPKVNIDRKALSSEDISSFKDFAALKQQFAIAGTPSLVGSWFAATFAGIAMVMGIAGIYSSQAPENHDLASKQGSFETHIEHKFSSSPENQAEGKLEITEMSVHTYKNKDGYEFIHDTGSKITIPANAFQTQQGELPEDIEFHYREYHDPISVWLSGIPMEYDSLEIYFFESAGMNELRAYSGGEELQLNPEKPIEISMISFDDSDEMNLYALNDKTGDWTYLDHLPHENLMETIREENSKIEQSIPELEAVNAQIEDLENKIAAIPQVKAYNQQKYSFDLDVDLQDFPALRGFKNVVFEVVNQNAFDTRFYDIEWENAEIKKTPDAQIYLLELSKQTRTERIQVIPVLQGKELQKALNIQETQKAKLQTQLDKHQISKEEILDNYNQKLEQFKKENEARAAEEQEKLEQDEKTIRQRKALNCMSEQNFQANSKAKYAKLEKAVVNTRKFFARFTGIFNFDCARRGPQARRMAREDRRAAREESDKDFQNNKFGKQKKVTLINKITGATIVPVTLFLIEKGRNLIYKFNREEQNKAFAFNPEAKNVVWALTKDDKIAVFRSEDFEHLPMEAETYNLDVTVSPESLYTKKDIEKFLGLNTFEESN